MSSIYEGTVAEIGTEQWGDLHIILAPTDEIAAARILESAASDNEEFCEGLWAISLRAYTDLIPGEWKYFTGTVKKSFHATVTIAP